MPKQPPPGVLPPPTQPPILPPPPVAPENPPTEGTFEDLVPGMTRAQVEAVVGLPTIDIPDNPGEMDSVRYDLEDESGSWFINYANGSMVKATFASLVRR